MDEAAREANLEVIRQYLRENVSESSVHDGPKQNGEHTLLVLYGTAGCCTLRISQSLLTDCQITCNELRHRIEQCNIVGKVLMQGSFYLNHDAISDESIVSL